MDPLLQQVQQVIQEYRMLESGQTVLVAVSGGADSMALLHCLWRLQERFALQLWVAHVNHQMRPEAADDANFVAAVAGHLGIGYFGGSRDVPAYQRQHKLSPEDAARRLRYAFLRSAATQLGADRIAVGHTADDQAETVLLHLLRGSGLRGLCGMPAVRGAVIRPLLQVSRSAIVEYLHRHRLPFRDDPSNTRREYSRNRLRLDVLPTLRRYFNPRLSEALGRTAQLLAEDETALQALAQQQFLAARVASQPGLVRLRIEALTALPLGLQRRVLRQALSEVLGDLHGVTASHVAAMVSLLQPGAGHARLMLPRGLVVERCYDALLLHRQASTTGLRVEVPLPIPGLCRLEALGLTVTSASQPRHAVAGPFPSGDVAWLDADRVGEPLSVRTRRSGDRLQPLGSLYTRKLKNMLIDAKIPRALRDRLPLVVAPQGIAWVAGLRLAEWAKVTPTTRTILRLQVVRHDRHEAVDACWEPR